MPTRCMRPSADAVAGTSRFAAVLRRFGRVTIIAALPTACLAIAAHILGLRVNLSPSIAPGIYRLTNDPIARGTTVLVCLPPPLSALARSRGYISAGSCVDGNAPIGKVVAAVVGDTVEVTNTGLAVNGERLPNTRPLVNDHDGRALPHVAHGRYVVPADQIWLISTHSSRSFDSRYFGPLSSTQIVSRVRPVLTLR
jgi:conjugative transfer signal peptidase TraF